MTRPSRPFRVLDHLDFQGRICTGCFVQHTPDAHWLLRHLPRFQPPAFGDGQEGPQAVPDATPSGSAPSGRPSQGTPDPNRNVSDGQDGSGQNSSLSGSIRPDRQAEVTPGAIGAERDATP